MLAAIAADPTAVPLWLVVALAAGMYPFGFMLGSECSACCGACGQCAEGTLPETLTVAISGIPSTTLGPPLVTLSFSSCYGSGAAGHAAAPVQSAPASDYENDRGPITAATVTNGGSGYARLGRVIPTVTATADGGSGAELSITLAAAKDSCNLDYWKVSKVSVVTGGSGYVDNQSITFSAAEGDSEQSAAVARLQTVRLEPEATIEVSSEQGTGAMISVSFDAIPGDPPQWRVDSVTVDTAGDLYVTGDVATLTPSTNTITVGPADFFVKAAHAEPTVSASVSTTAGTGAALSITLAPVVSYDGSDAWEVSAITIEDAGSGYEVYNTVDVIADDGITRYSCFAWVESVDASGAILSITLWSGGEYLKGGPITAVEVTNGGIYYGDSGEADSVDIDEGGSYYREDADEPPYVAEVTASASNIAPSNGSGAVLSGVVDDDPESETFGQITGVNVDEGGDGYLAHEVFESCLNRFNGRSIVVKRKYTYWSASIYGFFPMAGSPDECTYGYTCANIDSCALEAEAVLVQYRGPDEPMTINLYLHQRGQGNLPLGGGYLYHAAYGYFVASENVQDCSEIDITANGLPVPAWSHPATQSTDGATAHVQSGGEYEEVDACRRISAEDMNALYAEVTWGAFSSSSADSGSGCGWSSSVSIGGQVDTTGQWCEDWKDIFASVGGRCFEYHALPSVTLRIVRTDTCGWEWNNQPGWFQDGSFVCGTIERMVGFGGNWNNTYRQCLWCYPILRIVHDEETMTPISIELGDAVFSTWGPGAWWLENYDPEGKYMTEDAVCQDPGKPTFTFSVLP